MSTAADRRTQYAALPWRIRDGRVEVLLITSLKTKRWIIPKGWPMDAMAPHETAGTEAYEEAGIVGSIETTAIGSFVYDKVRKDGSVRECHVDVYPMQVFDQCEDWPERERRQTAWMLPERAARLVQESRLSDLLRGFSPAVMA